MSVCACVCASRFFRISDTNCCRGLSSNCSAFSMAYCLLPCLSHDIWAHTYTHTQSQVYLVLQLMCPEIRFVSGFFFFFCFLLAPLLDGQLQSGLVCGQFSRICPHYVQHVGCAVAKMAARHDSGSFESTLCKWVPSSTTNQKLGYDAVRNEPKIEYLHLLMEWRILEITFG